MPHLFDYSTCESPWGMFDRLELTDACRHPRAAQVPTTVDQIAASCRQGLAKNDGMAGPIHQECVSTSQLTRIQQVNTDQRFSGAEWL